MRAALVLIAALLAAPLSAAGEAPFVVQETGKGYPSLQQAVDAIGGGSGTILIALGTYAQCAVQEAGRIAYVAREAGRAVFDGGICEGKAALVLRGRSARVEGLVFQNMHVPDRNGAGIRIERGDLAVRESLFRDSENGILSADDPAGTIRIDHATFSRLGGCPEGHGCAHSLYVGGYGRLVVTRSRFERGAGGHYVKSRAPLVEITDS
ncbi:MAG TPA: right-handed parallel beta-helix repeat-containing protein, partial [Allosphingosinicella sp.]